MNQLLPIIRHQRRPLIEVDDRPVVVSQATPAQTEAPTAAEPVATEISIQASDANPVDNLDA